jgi:hypothetical protein
MASSQSGAMPGVSAARRGDAVELCLEPQILAARIAALLEPVGVDRARLDVLGVLGDRLQELALDVLHRASVRRLACDVHLTLAWSIGRLRSA